MSGKVRVLPLDTPVPVPPSVPYSDPGGYLVNELCGAEIRNHEVGLEPPTPDHVGYYCTRPPHGEDSPHVCHHRLDGEPRLFVVWGGE